MWCKNIAGRFFGLVTKHACDRQTDGQNYDSQDRASIAASRGKKHFFHSAYVLNTDLDVINIAADRQKFMTLAGELS